MGNRPLCPHCYRHECPWLEAYDMHWTGLGWEPTEHPSPEVCPHRPPKGASFETMGTLREDRKHLVAMLKRLEWVEHLGDREAGTRDVSLCPDCYSEEGDGHYDCKLAALLEEYR